MNKYEKHDRFSSDIKSENDSTHMDSVFGNNSRDCSWAVRDTEASSHRHICAAPVVWVCIVRTYSQQTLRVPNVKHLNIEFFDQMYIANLKIRLKHSCLDELHQPMWLNEGYIYKKAYTYQLKVSRE